MAHPALSESIKGYCCASRNGKPTSYRGTISCTLQDTLHIVPVDKTVGSSPLMKPESSSFSSCTKSDLTTDNGQSTTYNIQRTVHKLWWFSASQLKKLNKDKDSQKILRSTTRNEINSRIESIPSRITASGLWPPHWTSGFFVLETFG